MADTLAMRNLPESADDATVAEPDAAVAALQPRGAHLLHRAWRFWNHTIPPWLAAALAVAAGLLQIMPEYAALRHAWLQVVEHGGQNVLELANLAAYPRLLIGFGLLLMAGGLLLRARLAWVVALLLSWLAAGLAVWAQRDVVAQLVASGLLTAVLVIYARRFTRSSVAAGSLFALLGVGSLLVYAIVGSLWFGEGYSPPIRNLPTAVYYAVETMSTVGYGDIVPRTTEARMFTVSLIVLGITVFATTLSVVVGPLVGGSIKRTLEGRMHRESRRNHFVIIGVSTLAHTLWQSLRERNAEVTVIAPPGKPSPYPPEADVVSGDPTRDDVLRTAGVPQARAVMALRDDDAENAFIVLAVKELAPAVRTIAAVNDIAHLGKIRRVQPDMLFAPQVLGGEILLRNLFGEAIDNDTLNKLLFVQPQS